MFPVVPHGSNDDPAGRPPDKPRDRSASRNRKGKKKKKSKSAKAAQEEQESQQAGPSREGEQTREDEKGPQGEEEQKPGEEEKPAEPEKPLEQEKPVEEEKPVEQEGPVEPENPVEQEEPVEQEKAGEDPNPEEKTSEDKQSGQDNEPEQEPPRGPQGAESQQSQEIEQSQQGQEAAETSPEGNPTSDLPEEKHEPAGTEPQPKLTIVGPRRPVSTENLGARGEGVPEQPRTPAESTVPASLEPDSMTVEVSISGPAHLEPDPTEVEASGSGAPPDSGRRRVLEYKPIRRRRRFDAQRDAGDRIRARDSPRQRVSESPELGTDDRGGSQERRLDDIVGFRGWQDNSGSDDDEEQRDERRFAQLEGMGRREPDNIESMFDDIPMTDDEEDDDRTMTHSTADAENTALTYVEGSKHYFTVLSLPKFMDEYGYDPGDEEYDDQWAGYRYLISDQPWRGMIAVVDPRFTLRRAIRSYIGTRAIKVFFRLVRCANYSMLNQLELTRALLDAHKQIRISQKQQRDIHNIGERMLNQNWYSQGLGRYQNVDQINSLLEDHDALEAEVFELREKVEAYEKAERAAARAAQLAESRRRRLEPLESSSRSPVIEPEAPNVRAMRMPEDHPQLVEREKQLEKARTENAEMYEDMMKLQKERDEFKTKYQQAVEESKERGRVIESIQVETALLAEQLTAKARPVDVPLDIKDKIRGMSDALVFMEAENEQLEKNNKQLDRKNQQLEQHVTAQDREIQRLASRVVTLKEEQEKQEAANLELQQENLALRKAMTPEQSATLEQEMEAMQAKNQQQLAQSLVDDVASLDSQAQDVSAVEEGTIFVDEGETYLVRKPKPEKRTSQVEKLNVGPDMPAAVREILEAIRIARMPPEKVNESWIKILLEHLMAIRSATDEVMRERDARDKRIDELEAAIGKLKAGQPAELPPPLPDKAELKRAAEADRNTIARLKQIIKDLRLQQLRDEQKLAELAKYKEQFLAGPVAFPVHGPSPPLVPPLSKPSSLGGSLSVTKPSSATKPLIRSGRRISGLWERMVEAARTRAAPGKRLREFQELSQQHPSSSVSVTSQSEAGLKALIDQATNEPVTGERLKHLVEQARVILGPDSSVLGRMFGMFQDALRIHEQEKQDLLDQAEQHQDLLRRLEKRREQYLAEAERIRAEQEELTRLEQERLQEKQAAFDRIRHMVSKSSEYDIQRLVELQKKADERARESEVLQGELSKMVTETSNRVDKDKKRRADLDRDRERLKEEEARIRREIAADEAWLEERESNQRQLLLTQRKQQEQELKDRREALDREAAALAEDVVNLARLKMMMQDEKKKARKDLAEQREKIRKEFVAYKRRQEELKAQYKQAASEAQEARVALERKLMNLKKLFAEREEELKKSHQQVEDEMAACQRLGLLAEARLVQLEQEAEQMRAIFNHEIEKTKMRADQNVTTILLEMQMAKNRPRNESEICFCSLLRALFPRVYRAVLRDGTCHGPRPGQDPPLKSPGDSGGRPSTPSPSTGPRTEPRTGSQQPSTHTSSATRPAEGGNWGTDMRGDLPVPEGVDTAYATWDSPPKQGQRRLSQDEQRAADDERAAREREAMRSNFFGSMSEASGGPGQGGGGGLGGRGLGSADERTPEGYRTSQDVAPGPREAESSSSTGRGKPGLGSPQRRYISSEQLAHTGPARTRRIEFPEPEALSPGAMSQFSAPSVMRRVPSKPEEDMPAGSGGERRVSFGGQQSVEREDSPANVPPEVREAIERARRAADYASEPPPMIYSEPVYAEPAPAEPTPPRRPPSSYVSFGAFSSTFHTRSVGEGPVGGGGGPWKPPYPHGIPEEPAAGSSRATRSSKATATGSSKGATSTGANFGTPQTANVSSNQQTPAPETPSAPAPSTPRPAPAPASAAPPSPVLPPADAGPCWCCTPGGHGHGHGIIAADSWPWWYVCQVLTAGIWLVLLMLKQFANMQQLFLWLTALAVSPPRYLVGVTWWVLRLLYRAAWRRAPVWAQTRLKAPPDTRESPPAFWPAYRRPSAALILGVLTTAMVVFTFLAGEAVRRERNIWRAHNSWHWAYARNQGWVPRHPSLVPFEADYKLAVEPLLDRIVDVVHMFMFVGGYGQPDRPGERFVKWLLMEQV